MTAATPARTNLLARPGQHREPGITGGGRHDAEQGIYADRAEGLSLTQGAKASVTEHFANRAMFPSDNYDAGLAPPGSITGSYVSAVTIGSGDGEIAVTFGGKANSMIAGQQLLLQASDAGGSLTWSCSSQNIQPRYLPTSCR